MKKGLMALILGIGLTILPTKLNAQEISGLQKKEYSYDVFVSWLGNQGNASGNNKEINLQVANIDQLEFFKKGNMYYEVSNSKEGLEKFTYERKDSIWEFVDYDFKSKKEKLQKKMDEQKNLKISPKGTNYSKDMMVAPEVFDIFEGRIIPDTFKVVFFSKPYTFVKRAEEKKGDFVEVEYEPLGYDVSNFENKYLNGSPKILLKREPNGTYFPAGARASIGYKIFGINFSFEIRVLEKEVTENNLAVLFPYNFNLE